MCNKARGVLGVPLLMSTAVQLLAFATADFPVQSCFWYPNSASIEAKMIQTLILIVFRIGIGIQL
jgi:hypothetical protein